MSQVVSNSEDQKQCSDCGHVIEWNEEQRQWVHHGENRGCFLDQRNSLAPMPSILVTEMGKMIAQWEEMNPEAMENFERTNDAMDALSEAMNPPVKFCECDEPENETRDGGRTVVCVLCGGE